MEESSEEYKLNRLETTKEIGPLVDKHWREIREAKEKGEKVAWASGPMFIYPYATPNMVCHFMAGYAAYCGGRGAADDVLKAAEIYGELPDTCSYHRLHTGMAAAVTRGVPIKEERVILPIPDLMIAGRFCTEQSHYAEALHRRLGVRVVTIEWPVLRRMEDAPRIEKYVSDQVKEIIIPAIEEVSGQEFDEEAMRDILKVLKETCLIRNECWEYFKKKPSSWSLWDYGVSIAPVFYAMGKPESMEYYKHLIAELKERAKKNIPVLLPEGEKYRLFWDGWLPWAFLGRVIRMLVPKGALPICGRYPWEFFHIPEDINPDADDIVHEWVRIWYTGRAKGAYHDGPWGGEEFIEELVNEYSIDGIVMFSSKTCRMFNLGQWEILNKMDRKCGVPGVVIEADMVDSSMFSEAQIQTRLQALFETIDARRK